MELFCANCGQRRTPGAVFCVACGRPFEDQHNNPLTPPRDPPIAPNGWYLQSDGVQWYWNEGQWTHANVNGSVQAVQVPPQTPSARPQPATARPQANTESTPIPPRLTSASAPNAQAVSHRPLAGDGRVPAIEYGPDFVSGRDCPNCGYGLSAAGTCASCVAD